MTPIDMLHLNHGQPGAIHGDCFRCCIASVLDLPAVDVPHFMAAPDQDILWAKRLDAFLRPRGMFWVSIQSFPEWQLSTGMRPLVIAGGKSPRGEWGHNVVGEMNRDGFRLIHDPHPSRAGIIGEPEDYGLLCRLWELPQ